jgi:hypothetical protein
MARQLPDGCRSTTEDVMNTTRWIALGGTLAMAAILLLVLAAPVAAQSWTRHMGGAGSMEHARLCNGGDSERMAEIERCPMGDMNMDMHRSMMNEGMMGGMGMHQSMLNEDMMGGMGMRQSMMGSGTMSHSGTDCEPGVTGLHQHRHWTTPDQD